MILCSLNGLQTIATVETMNFRILCSLNGLQTIATVETMNFRILCFIKILPPLLGWQNLDRTIAYTRFHRIKGGVPPPPPPPPTTNNFDRMDEIQRFLWILLSVTLGAGFIKFYQLFKGHWWWGGGGGGTPPPPFILLNCVSWLTLGSATMCFDSVLM